MQTTKTSVLGAVNMLGLGQAHATRRCCKRPPQRSLRRSPRSIAADARNIGGNVNPTGPTRSCYDEGKRCAETLFFDYRRQHGLPIKVARIFNTYGTRMHPNDGRVVSNFIVQALKGEDITIYGEGSQTRSFCYVSDLVDGLVRLMETGPDVTGPINLGNPVEFTMIELAEAVLKLTSSSSRLVHMPLPSDDPKQRQPDIACARAELGWEPKVPLREGLAKTIDYFASMI